uniref:Ig-like domain-containing protein n=1 Tax=Sarcophilus harrisii TaxID=9305 RepID=A0A7N4V7G5_SARHA
LCPHWDPPPKWRDSVREDQVLGLPAPCQEGSLPDHGSFPRADPNLCLFLYLKLSLPCLLSFSLYLFLSLTLCISPSPLSCLSLPLSLSLPTFLPSLPALWLFPSPYSTSHFPFFPWKVSKALFLPQNLQHLPFSGHELTLQPILGSRQAQASPPAARSVSPPPRRSLPALILAPPPADRYDPPSLSAWPSSVVAKGQAVTLRCYSGNRYDRSALYKDGEQVTKAPAHVLAEGAQADFSIPAVTSAHGGTYRCYSFQSLSPHEWSFPSDSLELKVTGTSKDPPLPPNPGGTQALTPSPPSEEQASSAQGGSLCSSAAPAA